MSRDLGTPAWALLLMFVVILGIPASSYGQAPGWTEVAPMSVARLGHSMVELRSGPNALGLSPGPGKVMVIGGFDSEPLAPHVPANPLASCEIYDPTTNTWTATAPHPVSAGWRWAAEVSNGMVLVVGGSKTLTKVVASSYLFDPKTNTWIATKPLPVAMTNPHAFMRPVSLPNGQVVIAGGIDQNGIDAVNKKSVPPFSKFSYLFTLNVQNPALSSWDFTRDKSDGEISPMPEGRTTSALVLMANGKVLNVGGLGPNVNGTEAATNTAIVFDPATGTWSSVNPMPPIYGLGEDENIAVYPTGSGSRWAPYAQLLNNGQVLVAGGQAGLVLSFTFRSSAIIFDPAANSWTLTNPMLFQRPFGAWLLKSSDGTGVLFAGEGYFSGGTFTLHDLTGEIYAPTTQQWTLAPSDGGPTIAGPFDSFESQSVQLKTGKMQVAGGIDLATASIATSSSWIYKP